MERRDNAENSQGQIWEIFKIGQKDWRYWRAKRLQCHKGTYIFEENAAKFCCLRRISPELFFQVIKQGSGEVVDFFNVAEYGDKLIGWKHLWSSFRLLQITLKLQGKNQSDDKDPKISKSVLAPNTGSSW